MMIVGVNNFVRRQVKGSGKTYSMFGDLHD